MQSFTNRCHNHANHYHAIVHGRAWWMTSDFARSHQLSTEVCFGLLVFSGPTPFLEACSFFRGLLVFPRAYSFSRGLLIFPGPSPFSNETFHFIIENDNECLYYTLSEELLAICCQDICYCIIFENINV